MRKTLPFLAAVAVTAALASGCANVENKFSRGMSNMFEVTRLGELQRSMEQTGLYDGPEAAYSIGFVKGFNRTLARTGVGIYEVVTAPFPPYGPVWTDYLSPNPVFPDSNPPGLPDDSIYATDAHLGFSGGELAPHVPGSKFGIFNGP